MSDAPPPAAKQDKISSAALRQHAEADALACGSPFFSSQAKMSADQVQILLHELRVHQIELELQNEQLRSAQLALELERSRYFDLYDLAPVAYCTLSDKGLILEAILAPVPVLAPVIEPGTPRAVFTVSVSVIDVAAGLEIWGDMPSYLDYLQRFATIYSNAVTLMSASLAQADRPSHRAGAQAGRGSCQHGLA